jgi:hypothetical protein
MFSFLYSYIYLFIQELFRTCYFKHRNSSITYILLILDPTLSIKCFFNFTQNLTRCLITRTHWYNYINITPRQTQISCKWSKYINLHFLKWIGYRWLYVGYQLGKKSFVSIWIGFNLFLKVYYFVMQFVNYVLVL